MLERDKNYMVKNKNFKIEEVVSIPPSLFKSMKGQYFVGQTDNLLVGNNLNAWAALSNPMNSFVNLYTNVFTISNFSDEYLTAEIWLNTTIPENSIISNKVSPTNTALDPLPKNQVDIRFLSATDMVPINGINVYERIVPPNTTLVSEEDGKFIEGPGGSYVLVIKSTSSNLANVIVALGWWEKPNC
ncbi:hypothetical protein SAMN02745163_02904 [Clostridium cavendishii DSM 21758]|uniref:Uncharacterized protein n=1 Tax=Clostridium cavendishii DSM 21758 TaxID=1121302 RepID=A0A1M6NH16_9CLOT|nr:DUF6143 family protein [Clostridium cavendishii]SHJ94922.1 hypothetical protein SAMN02745163_02904 [Clostridium cavendishii DSM 21758]